MRNLKIALIGEGVNDIGIADGQGGWKFGTITDVHNPESDYPKFYLKRILENGSFENTTETYKNIVINNNIFNLRKNCPYSFEPFFIDVENFKKSLFKG